MQIEAADKWAARRMLWKKIGISTYFNYVVSIISVFINKFDLLNLYGNFTLIGEKKIRNNAEKEREKKKLKLLINRKTFFFLKKLFFKSKSCGYAVICVNNII